MIKILLCFTLLAVSHLASADVPAYSLPFSDFLLLQNSSDYLTNSCGTVHGRFYYMDIADDGSRILQVWDSKTQTMGSAISMTNIYNQVAAFQATLGDNPIVNAVVQCIGENAYISVAYNSTNANGLQLFLLIESSTDVPTFALPWRSFFPALDVTEYFTDSYQGPDDTLYYILSDLMVWNSSTQVAVDDQPGAEYLDTPMWAWIRQSDCTTAVVTFNCIGNNQFLSVNYKNSTNSGLRHFWFIDTLEVYDYDLPLNPNFVANSSLESRQRSCSTTDGWFHYLDLDDDNQTLVMRSWMPFNSALGDSTSLADAYSQINTTLGNDVTEQVIILQCIESSVFLNVAYQSNTNGGIELLLVKKAANLLKLSSGFLLLAIIALLL